MDKHHSPSFYAARKKKQELKRSKTTASQKSNLNLQLRAEFGLPEDAKILFLKKRPPSGHPLTLHHGTVVCFDDETMDLLLVARFHPHQTSPPSLIQEFNSTISLLYEHGKRRNPIKINGAVNKTKSEFSGGKMCGIGYRPGYDKTAKGGVYALNATTSGSLQKIEQDEEAQLDLPRIEDFITSRFSSLSLKAYLSNCEIGQQTRVPSFSSPSPHVAANTQVFASNVIVTFDGFHNGPHSDQDATKFSVGFFTTINRHDGSLAPAPAGGTESRVLGSRFVLDEYDTIIDHDHCDGVVEQVWNTSISHHTPIPQFFNSSGTLISPTKSSITRFGCSCQISNWLVKRIDAIRKNRTEEEWRKCIVCLVTGYDDEVSKKKDKLILQNSLAKVV